MLSACDPQIREGRSISIDSKKRMPRTHVHPDAARINYRRKRLMSRVIQTLPQWNDWVRFWYKRNETEERRCRRLWPLLTILHFGAGIRDGILVLRIEFPGWGATQ